MKRIISTVLLTLFCLTTALPMNLNHQLVSAAEECAPGQHSFEKWQVTVWPEENKPGEQTRTCTVCGYRESKPFGFSTEIPQPTTQPESTPAEEAASVNAQENKHDLETKPEKTKNSYYNGKTIILHSNDVHGALDGYAYIAFLKSMYESYGATVILVDAGDFSQGNRYVSSSKGYKAIEMMNLVGYDIVVPGNHEFDYGYNNLIKNLESAKFTTLCANVYLKSTNSLILPATKLITLNGVKIGFFGLLTPETAYKVNPGLISEIYFKTSGNLYTTTQSIIDNNLSEADIVIGVTHLGVDIESMQKGYRSIDLLANTSGIDFLIDGHSHTTMTSGEDGKPIQSTGSGFENVGVIVIDNEKKAIVDNYLINTANIQTDGTVAAKAADIMAEIDAKYNAVFAESSVRLNGDRAVNRTQETNLGDLITDAMVWSVVNAGGIPGDMLNNVVGITNGGGIRASIEAGSVSMNDINTVLPFGNTVTVIYVKGSELLEALEASTFSIPKATSCYPQTSGITWTIDTTKEYAQGEIYKDANGKESSYYGPATINRVSIESVNGVAFDPEATYAVVTNNFCAAGGYTYNVFMRAYRDTEYPCFDTSIPLDEALISYISTELSGKIGDKYAEPRGTERQISATNREPAYVPGFAMTADELAEQCDQLINSITEESWKKVPINMTDFPIRINHEEIMQMAKPQHVTGEKGSRTIAIDYFSDTENGWVLYVPTRDDNLAWESEDSGRMWEEDSWYEDRTVFRGRYYYDTDKGNLEFYPLYDPELALEYYSFEYATKDHYKLLTFTYQQSGYLVNEQTTNDFFSLRFSIITQENREYYRNFTVNYTSDGKMVLLRVRKRRDQSDIYTTDIIKKIQNKSQVNISELPKDKIKTISFASQEIEKKETNHTLTAEIPVEAHISISPRELSTPGPVVVTINVRNISSANLTRQLTLHDPNGKIVFRFGQNGIATLNPGAQMSVSLQGNVTQEMLDQGCMTYTLRWQTFAGIELALPVTAEVCFCTEHAGLRIVRTITPEVVHSGQSIKVTYELTNTGTVSISNIQVREKLIRTPKTLKSLAIGATTTVDFTTKMGNADLTSGAEVTFQPAGSNQSETVVIEEQTIPLIRN